MKKESALEKAIRENTDKYGIIDWSKIEFPRIELNSLSDITDIPPKENT